MQIYSSTYRAVFDHEVRSEYSFFLAVEDNARTGKRLSETISVTVIVGNLNDQPTLFTQDTYSECILIESLMSGTM